MKFIKNLQAKEDFFGIAKGPFTYKEVKDTYDEKIANLEDKQIDIVEGVINKAIENGAKRCGGVLETSSGSNFLVTSEKVEAQEKAQKELKEELKALKDKSVFKAKTPEQPEVKKEAEMPISVMGVIR